MLQLCPELSADFTDFILKQGRASPHCHIPVPDCLKRCNAVLKTKREKAEVKTEANNEAKLRAESTNLRRLLTVEANFFYDIHHEDDYQGDNGSEMDDDDEDQDVTFDFSPLTQ
ncbi:hypothetical protein TNIN_443351 [Trichonephila inaurata madagascariensis]|uniref:Uncharacterized protein n=1 Tax=Trichonephila inaurata madagascariensis TaxID=2747483 RepID=A0A8X6WMZ6_9ARAC|nr:hypothetical protein TNIN_443351 [Trichonephila inaurata madagascariensis]